MLVIVVGQQKTEELTMVSHLDFAYFLLHILPNLLDLLLNLLLLGHVLFLLRLIGILVFKFCIYYSKKWFVLRNSHFWVSGILGKHRRLVLACEWIELWFRFGHSTNMLWDSLVLLFEQIEFKNTLFPQERAILLVWLLRFHVTAPCSLSLIHVIVQFLFLFTFLNLLCH